MSDQLKSYKMVDEDYCDNVLCVIASDVYLKSEVDKLIAELNMRICDGDEDFEIANNQINRLMKIVRHQKYKRCLALSEMCMLKSRISYFEKKINKTRMMSKWRNRWFGLAETFKEDK